jgi:hypothetical protein
MNRAVTADPNNCTYTNPKGAPHSREPVGVATCRGRRRRRVGTRVADVAEVVVCDAADVHADLSLHPRPEDLLLRQGVGEPQPRRVLLSLRLRVRHGGDVEGRGAGAEEERGPGRGRGAGEEEEKLHGSRGGGVERDEDDDRWGEKDSGESRRRGTRRRR